LILKSFDYKLNYNIIKINFKTKILFFYYKIVKVFQATNVRFLR